MRPSLLFALLFAAPVFAAEQTVDVAFSAQSLYDAGQAYDLMRGPGGTVVLSDHTLIENDGAGAGYSEKGVHTESLHRGVRAKKIIHLDDARARAAHLLLYLQPQDPADTRPYAIEVNGERVDGIPVPWHEGIWHWVPIPVDRLREGSNEFVAMCDAPEGKGYDLLFARADEYALGGGPYTHKGNTAAISAGFVAIPDGALPADIERIDVGASSARSVDGGATWTPRILDPATNTAGEYTMRLHLERYRPEGALESQPIDLWLGAGGESVVTPHCALSEFTVEPDAETPDGTAIEYAVRFGASPDPAGESWSEYLPLPLAGPPPAEARFAQIRAEFQSADPLATPALRSIRVRRTVAYKPVPEHTYYVRSVENPEILRPSYPLRFEPAGTPALAQLRERLGIDALLAGTEGDFERINRLRHHVSQQWHHALPLPGYPEWDGLAILDRRDAVGKGGMCQQFTILFMQALASIGYPARHVNMFNHEAHEVFVPSLDKWVAVDPESVFDSYEYNTETGEPLGALEQHDHFLARYGLTAANPIPWMSPEPWCNWPPSGLPETPQPLAISTFTPHLNDPDPAKRPPQHGLAGFVRIIPRSDFLVRPAPRPLSNGSTYWPWNGYLCWYDPATPRKLHYALHSDRVADFNPTLHRVAFAASHGDEPGTVDLAMATQTPNFETFEIRINDGPWRDAPSTYAWRLRPSGLNRIEMRARNAFGVNGLPSHLEVLWHYRPPFAPKPE